jgi:hypothetical protein
MTGWPPAVHQFRNLQYLELKCGRLVEQGLDLAALKHIPNISIHVQRGLAELCLSSGSWKSIEIYGASVAFGDVGDFVKGTEKFLFVGDEECAGSMAGRLKQACGRHYKECFTRSYQFPHLSKGMSITNVRDIFEAETGLGILPDAACVMRQLLAQRLSA